MANIKTPLRPDLPPTTVKKQKNFLKNKTFKKFIKSK